MKLIDLLVQELPEHGGWPDGVARLAQDPDGGIQMLSSRRAFYGCVGWAGEGRDDFRGQYIRRKHHTIAEDNATSIITRKQYEAALAASKQEWNGEGLPPVGCECMVRGEIGDDGWYECKIIAHTFFGGYDCAAFQTKSTVSVSSAGNFKPLRSEADKKRDAAVTAMEHYDQSCESIYDAIAAGKIPGVKLEG